MTRMAPILNRPEAIRRLRDEWHRRFPPGCARHYRVEVSVEAEQAEKREEQNHLCVSENEPQLKEKREYALDNTLSETFPCSDPLSSIPNPTSCLFEMGER
jgi:hypothetical protein